MTEKPNIFIRLLTKASIESSRTLLRASDLSKRLELSPSENELAVLSLSQHLLAKESWASFLTGPAVLKELKRRIAAKEWVQVKGVPIEQVVSGTFGQKQGISEDTLEDEPAGIDQFNIRIATQILSNYLFNSNDEKKIPEFGDKAAMATLSRWNKDYRDRQ